MSTGEIVVGVDGSEPGRAALGWAIQEARLRSCRLRLVYGCLSPLITIDVTGEALCAIEEAGEQILAAAARVVHAEAPDIEVTTSLCRTGGAQALEEASRHADLVVVGNRGRGGFAGLLLGSVSSQVVHHAACPVAVVRT